MREVTDLRAEADELHAQLATLPAADWDRATLFKAWTINDVVQHLHAGDLLAAASARDPVEFKALAADMRAKRESGLTRVQETRQRLGDLTGPRLLARWRETLASLCDALDARDPKARLTWAGPDMGVRMFTTARQMEIWSHGQAIYDLLGRTRAPTDRLRNIAEIGVRTFGWTYVNRGLPVPPDPPRVRLTAPSGAVWEWLAESRSGMVEGEALEFCQVVTQTRNVADTRLVVTGAAAVDWMSIAQCFAGPPEEPPAPGSRRMAI
ncbi:MAG: TIGR03084 family protein [Rhodospirillales bacterium]|nr:MAG: TIGR03084 family protein [Rhodospirillales bacterium]